MAKVNQLNDIALLRCLATVSLVIWHSYCSYVCWGVADTPLNSFYFNLFTRIFPDANMPLFTILAGYLFHYLLIEKGKYQDFKGFLTNKINRLLIPFIILGGLINYLEYGKNIIDIVYGKPNHLWYCLMLFYVYIIFWIVEKKIGAKANAIISLLCFLFLTYIGIGILSRNILGGLYFPIYYYAYFYFGFLFRKKHNLIIEYNNKITVVLSIAIYFIFAYFNHDHLIGLTSIAYFVMLFLIVNVDSVQKRAGEGKTNEIINTFSKYSFGIYVFHQWIIWNLTREPHCLNFIQPLLNEHYIIAPIIMVISVLTICIILTHFSLKTKLGRYLLI